jgi:hydrogenase-4 component B
MELLLVALGLLGAGGVLALLTARQPALCRLCGLGGAVAGSALGLVPAAQVLCGTALGEVNAPWMAALGGEFSVALDPLSAFFAVPIFLLTGLAAVYGAGYLHAYEGKKNLGVTWFFYNLLTASMVLVVAARNGLLFLVAWEVMALASYFLVIFNDDKEEVRRAGWTYLVASHLGTAFLLALFALLGKHAGTLNFDDMAWAGQRLPVEATSVLFLLAVVGFGTKAGFMPLHVWLPEAHPAAPSHVSAVMSGVMIKTGIYGLVRLLSMLGGPPAWWGWLLVAVGLTSGVLGILFALGQKDLKRLLAYSSVENVGVIALGLGVGVLGLSSRQPALAVLGFAGALLHVLNHALFKGLLFLGAGSVLHGTHTADMDRLGGLLRRMPWTGYTFLVGALAIAALPPLNGFVSEFLIYLGAFRQEMSGTPLGLIAPLAVIAGLALIGGLAVACFTKAFGIVFLGAPRGEAAARAQPVGLLLRWPMVALAAGCPLVAMLSPVLVPALAPVVGTVAGLDPAGASRHLASATWPLTYVLVVAAVLVVLVGGLAWLRHVLLRGRPVAEADTWGCGYLAPTTRMQYTASSFAQPLTDLFQPVLRTRKQEPKITAYFPSGAELHAEAEEPVREAFYAPLFRGVGLALGKLRWLQHGRVQLYVLYIALTILVLLVWYLGGAA